MRRIPTRCWLVLCLATIVSNAMANSDQTGPPSRYPLAQVSISVLRQAGRGTAEDYRITIGGDGSGTCVRSKDGRSVQTDIRRSKEDLIALLNDFYAIRFFELPDNYSVNKRVLLRDNTIVATVARKRLDMGTTRACVQLGDYKKCVTIVGDEPADAAQLVKTIEALFLIPQ
jgi:hypothetical protein